ncbi:MAG: M20 family metallopeptidase [Rubricoccaceae bacterium]
MPPAETVSAPSSGVPSSGVPSSGAPSNGAHPSHGGAEGALRADLVALRRYLHQHPELGFDEHETAAHVRAWLRARGLEASLPMAGTGFFVEIEGAHPGPTIGYRADMDALPIQDEKDVRYRSRTPGVAHACGHDAHTAIACGVATLLYARRDELHGNVRVFFQPNEERSPSGAPRMIAEGVLDGLEAVYAVHVDPQLPVGRVGLRAGALTAACSPFVVRVSSGASGHSARPHETVDTVWVASQVALQLYQLVGRVTDARRSAVLTICRFRAGEALNVIPSEVEFGGTLRCTDNETIAELRDRIRQVTGALGAAYDADVSVTYEDRLPAVVNTPGEIATVREAVQALLGPEAAVPLDLPSMGGEDFAYYLEQIPGAMVRIGTAGGKQTRYPLHHARFDIDEAALPLAARLMTEVLVRHLRHHAAGVRQQSAGS